MHEAIETIRSAEEEARKIVTEVQSKSEIIRKEAEDGLGEVFRTAYDEAIAEAERTSLELINKAKKDAESDSKIITEKVESQVEEVKKKARNRLGKAIDHAFNKLIL